MRKQEQRTNSVKGLLFVVSAPSGAGKTSLCKEVLKRINQRYSRPLKWSCSYTTRAPRPGEKNGKDYFFVSEREFVRMIQAGEFAEWAFVHNHRYGTSKKYLEQAQKKGIDLLLEIDCQGARALRRKKLAACFIFILPPSLAELRKRLLRRGTESAEVVSSRLERAREEVEEYEHYDYIIINERFAIAAKELEAIILAERARLRVRQDQIQAIVKQFRR